MPPITGTRITAGPQGLNGVKTLESYVNENWPRKHKLWISPIRPRNTTAPKPVMMPTLSASSEIGKRRKRRMDSSVGATGAGGALIKVSTIGATIGPGERVSSVISAHLWTCASNESP